MPLRCRWCFFIQFKSCSRNGEMFTWSSGEVESHIEPVFCEYSCSCSILLRRALEVVGVIGEVMVFRTNCSLADIAESITPKCPIPPQELSARSRSVGKEDGSLILDLSVVRIMLSSFFRAVEDIGANCVMYSICRMRTCCIIYQAPSEDVLAEDRSPADFDILCISVSCSSVHLLFKLKNRPKYFMLLEAGIFFILHVKGDKDY